MKKILFDQNKNIVSKSIKNNRVKNDLTQIELATKMQIMGVNLDQQMISKIENNARFVTDYELACFCVILKISIDDMLKDFYENYVK